MPSRFWSGVPEHMPPRLPLPIPELAYIARMALELLPLPAWKWRDHAVNYLRHVSIHRRFPKKQLLINDVFYWIKVGPVLSSPLAALVSDKELVKEHIAKRVGDKYNIPTLAILKTPEDIDAFDFPAACIIKPTHASTQYIARKHGEPLDMKRIKDWLKLDFHAKSFEPNYRTLVPKVIVEPWVFGKVETTELKLFCVEGKVRHLNIIADRFAHYRVASFDPDWNETHYKIHQGANHGKFERPKHFDEIKSIAERLSADFFFTRIDLYYDGHTIKCGEITNCSAAGLEVYNPREGELLHSRQLFSEASEKACEAFFSSDARGEAQPTSP